MTDEKLFINRNHVGWFSVCRSN